MAPRKNARGFLPALRFTRRQLSHLRPGVLAPSDPQLGVPIDRRLTKAVVGARVAELELARVDRLDLMFPLDGIEPSTDLGRGAHCGRARRERHDWESLRSCLGARSSSSVGLPIDSKRVSLRVDG
jgi:hypothetical protein